ncbi:hypothetical protein L6452_46305 [Arctium lappa]|nr:hypothetical protein L6452_46305 [Arctium lappa]
MGTGDQSPPQTTRIPTGEAWSGATRCVTPRQTCPRPNASGATCVQKLDGSRDSAIHTKYRICYVLHRCVSPRYPLPRVVYGLMRGHDPCTHRKRGNTGRALLSLVFPWHMPFSGILATSPAANRPRRRDPNTSPDHSIAGITAAAGTRLALQWILVKGFRLYSFQLPDSFEPVLLFIVTTSPCQDWVILRLLPSLDVVAVSQAPSPESNPNSPSPVTT